MIMLYLLVKGLHDMIAYGNLAYEISNKLVVRQSKTNVNTIKKECYFNSKELK